MKIKTKNSKGEEIEIEETEVITAVREEYEKKLKEKDNQITSINEQHEKEKDELRKEHVKQLRAVLTGRKDVKEEKEFEEEEIDEEEELVKKAKEHFKKII